MIKIETERGAVNLKQNDKKIVLSELTISMRMLVVKSSFN